MSGTQYSMAGRSITANSITIGEFHVWFVILTFLKLYPHNNFNKNNDLGVGTGDAYIQWRPLKTTRDLTNMDNMPTNHQRTSHQPLTGMTTKVIYTTIAVLLIMIGLAGLVVPIIPGILFLLGAVLLLSRVSRRVHRWSEGQVWISAARVRLIQLQGLRPMARLKFAGLLGARTAVTGLRTVVAQLNGLVKWVKSPR